MFVCTLFGLVRMCVYLCGLVRVCLYFFSPFFCCTDLRGFLVLYCYCYSRKTCPSPPKVAGNLGLRVRASVAYPLSQRKVRFFPLFFWVRTCGNLGLRVRVSVAYPLSFFHREKCVCILLYMCLHTVHTAHTTTTTFVYSYSCICILILQYVCVRILLGIPHARANEAA